MFNWIKKIITNNKRQSRYNQLPRAIRKYLAHWESVGKFRMIELDEIMLIAFYNEYLNGTDTFSDAVALITDNKNASFDCRENDQLTHGCTYLLWSIIELLGSDDFEKIERLYMLLIPEECREYYIKQRERRRSDVGGSLEYFGKCDIEENLCKAHLMYSLHEFKDRLGRYSRIAKKVNEFPACRWVANLTLGLKGAYSIMTEFLLHADVDQIEKACEIYLSDLDYSQYVKQERTKERYLEHYGIDPSLRTFFREYELLNHRAYTKSFMADVFRERCNEIQSIMYKSEVFDSDLTTMQPVPFTYVNMATFFLKASLEQIEEVKSILLR